MGFADEAASLAQTIKFGKEADGQQNLGARAFTIIIPMSTASENNSNNNNCGSDNNKNNIDGVEGFL